MEYEKTDRHGFVKTKTNVVLNTDINSLNAYKKQKNLYGKINIMEKTINELLKRIENLESKFNVNTHS